ncbi:uncharacterized protein LOC131245027 isoform X3 [Magnolia sinica]|uniref:uncharacterized protein LOC131245027 isoform X3 n=1 Tax=Magnolia sinica TaxID=86752 RepID=UPI00265B7032|nr:uncharacterized protein LOC131245027 isoform X3 [Magnolia sinica]
MRCQPVACLWYGGSPHLHHHRITARAVLNQPPTLYTGGSDGSIIWWNLNPPHNREIWPMAMLCGHATPIVGLEICIPIISHGQKESSSNVSSTSSGSAALMSACTDGVLCIWSRGSGHCRRRRKLPPWVGTPSLLSSLPLSRRYVCIACNFSDAMQASNSGSVETAEIVNPGYLQNETATDKEAHFRRTSKCSIVIVDSCTLNIVQTIFHGSLTIGSLKFMAVVPSFEDMKKQSVIMTDALGQVESIAILEPDPNGEAGSGLQRSSSYMGRTSVEADSLQHDGVQAVSVSANGKLLALVFKTHCTFMSRTSETAICEISLADGLLCNEGPLTPACPIGGMFLQSGCSDNALDADEGSVEQFAVWSDTGAAIVYKISVSGVTFDVEPCCEIPAAVAAPHSVKMLISYCQLNDYLLRIESLCFEVHASTSWQPRVSIWLVHQPLMAQIVSNGQLGIKKSDNSGDPCSCIMVGEGSFLGDWVGTSCSLSETEAVRQNACLKATEGETDKSSHQNCVASPTNFGNGLLLKGQIVSSSLVLSEDFYAPYAVVYGFYNGEIQVVRFEMFHQEPNFIDGSFHHNIDPCISEQSLLGHTGAVLCLAAHHMVATSSEQHFKRALVSGSSDCTIRIWDMDVGSLVSVMHHHVAPIRQIILPLPWTDCPWSNCFLSVGEDSCVALVSLETLRVERMFPGHPSYPTMVVWDSRRGYIACLCRSFSASSGAINALYLWDVKTGARERTLRGNASHSMFDHFCRGINVNSVTDNILGGTTSASSLLLSVTEDTSVAQSHITDLDKGITKSLAAGNTQQRIMDFHGSDGSPAHDTKGKLPISKTAHEFTSHAADHSSIEQAPSLPLQHQKHLIKCSCPYPGIATLKFNLSSLMYPCQRHKESVGNGGKQEIVLVSEKQLEKTNSNDSCDMEGIASHPIEEHTWVRSLEGCLLRFSLSFLHLWNVDQELDKYLTDEMNVCKPESFVVASGLQGDKGSLTVAFPGLRATLELWRSSSEFCTMQSLAMVSLAQRMISLSRSTSAASSALAGFYTRNFAEKVPDIKPPSLQLLVSFWQDPSEHVRMAARSLFHCAASRSIPLPLYGPKLIQHALHSSHINGVGVNICKNTGETSTNSLLHGQGVSETQGGYQDDECSILSWLESFEMEDWISCIGGTSQDAMASHIIVAAALAVWYPSIVKPSLGKLVVHPLMKLVMAMSDKYSSTAAELLAEGMESTWKACIGPEIPRLIGDIFFQIECVSGAPANNAMQNPSLAVTIRETLVGILLPSLAMADVIGFLNVIESQIWATASDSPVHLISLMTLIRVVRGSPKPLSLHLDKAVNFILQTMDHGNSVMRRACLQSSMAALREVVRVFPMVALNEASTRLAVGDAIGDICSATIRIYDMQSVTKIKVLDASGPPGLPSLLGGVSDTMITAVISALSFSPDGEEKTREFGDADSLKLLIHNLDLSYRLIWVGERKVVLTRHRQELGTFQL